MKRDIFLRLLPAIMMFIWLQGTGCLTDQSAYESIYNRVYRPLYDSVYKPVYKKVKGRKPVLSKRVLVLPVLDQAGVGEPKATEITKNFVEQIQKDGHLLVQRAEQPLPSTVKIRSPKFGIAIDPDLAKKGEELGMNALIMPVLNPFEVTTKRKGVWPFHRVRREMEISLLVNAVDLINGTLFLTNLVTKKVKLPKSESEGEKVEKKISSHQLDKILSSIVKDQASAIVDKLREQPWRGRVLSTNGKTVIINAGKDIGLREGSVFEVFGRGESILSVSGRSLYLLGPKVGEVRTVRVMDSHSSAVPLTDGSFMAGQVIRIKN